LNLIYSTAPLKGTANRPSNHGKRPTTHSTICMIAFF